MYWKKPTWCKEKKQGDNFKDSQGIFTGFFLNFFAILFSSANLLKIRAFGTNIRNSHSFSNGQTQVHFNGKHYLESIEQEQFASVNFKSVLHKNFMLFSFDRSGFKMEKTLQIFCRVLFSKNLLDFYEAHSDRKHSRAMYSCATVNCLTDITTGEKNDRGIGSERSSLGWRFYGNISKGKLYEIINGRGVMVLPS